MRKTVGGRTRRPPRTWLLILLILVLGHAAMARELVVTSTADSGIGTLRWALQTARSRDVITFDPAVFPPDAPATIFPRAELPSVSCGSLTIDASSAGVIIDGSDVPGDWNNGLRVYSSDNTVMGLQIVSYAGSGIAVTQGGRHNTIGGDRSLGSGPVGQGNLLSGNGIGINLCDSGTSENTVLGNLVGVAADGVSPWGNRDFGIFIEDDVHDNVIGPGNVIAYNKHGITITGAGAVRNRITQNDIHSNTQDIALWSGGNASLEAPVIADFNAEVGSVSGFTCAGCLVELFSDTESERSIYEGDARADESGRFAFSGETLLEGESLRATATDSQGNTGPFSIPTRGSGAGRILQTGNVARKQLLVTYPSSELDDNRIGGMWNGLWQFDDQEEWAELFKRQMLGLGLKRARLTINSISEFTFGNYVADMSQPEMSVAPFHDALFTMVAEAGVEITYTLMFWDKESPHTEEVLSGPRFQTEDQIVPYLNFARFIVGHFKDRVVRFEIWNEPNLGDPGQHINVKDYVELVRRVVPVIRAEFPEAMIQVGGTGNLREPDSEDYFFEILESDIMPLVDVVSCHPLYGTAPGDDYYTDYYYNYPALMREIKQVAEAHGFLGEYAAEELTWWVAGEFENWTDEPWRFSAVLAAKYYARAVLMNLGMDITAGVGGISERPMVFPALRSLCTVMAGHEAIDMPVEIDIETEGPVATCAFRYPSGDRMLAIWTDGIAQDEDVGAPATIRFPNLIAGAVTGIDVLQGFEQELVFETDGDDTIVRNLLVKDYPILIRLSDLTFGPDYEETVGDGFHRLGDVDAVGDSADHDGDGVPDDDDYCPDFPGSKGMNGC